MPVNWDLAGLWCLAVNSLVFGFGGELVIWAWVWYLGLAWGWVVGLGLVFGVCGVVCFLGGFGLPVLRERFGLC